MAKISLKKDYMDGNVLYGKDLNPNFETIETTINANDDVQAETNAEVEEALTQLSSDMTQAQTDIGELQEDVTNLESGITSGDSTTLESAKSYTDTKLQDYAKTTDVPTKISQLENDDNTVKDASYVHTDNNFSDTDKSKLDSLNNYELPIASTSTLGGIKLGEGLESEADGTVNVTGGGGSGENGATFTPSVDDSGNLSWTNDKGLPNPDPVNIKGPKGDTGATGEQGATGPQGPQGETGPQGPQGETGPQGDPGPAGADGVTPTIGENGNWYLGETDTGKPSRGGQGPKGDTGDQGPQGLPGPTGPGVPTGGTTGQVLSKTGDGDYETAWKDAPSGGGGIPELIGTQEAPVLLYNIIETGIYKIIGSYKQTEAGKPTNNDGGSLLFYVDKDEEGNITQRFWATNTAFNMQARVSLAFAGGAENLKNVSFDNYKMASNLQHDGSDKFVNASSLRNSIGYNDKNSLQTTDKSSLVAAINELNTRLAALENPTE